MWRCVLAPIVASQGRQCRAQTMTVAVRALATRELWLHQRRFGGRREAWSVSSTASGLPVITGVPAVALFKNSRAGVVIGRGLICTLVAGRSAAF